jgi:hypothetical protein
MSVPKVKGNVGGVGIISLQLQGALGWETTCELNHWDCEGIRHIAGQDVSEPVIVDQGEGGPNVQHLSRLERLISTQPR